MSEGFDFEIVEFFLGEALEVLDLWESCCISLDKAYSENQVDELFRAAHNLKGSAKAVGMLSFGSFIHEIENVISKLRDGNLLFSQNVLDILLKSEEELRIWVNEQQNNLENGELVKVPELIIQIHSILNQDNQVHEEVILLEDEVHFEEVVKPIDKLVKKESLSENFDLESIKNEIFQIETNDESKVKAESKNRNESIRVSSDLIENLIKMVGELSISHSLVNHDAKSKALTCSSKCFNSILLTSKLLKQVQDLAMSLRMQSLEKMFNRLERICRDISKQQKKKVKVVIEGSLVTLDKLVIENITDPLVHIVRNAIDHGIESAELRRELNKDEEAVLLISAKQKAGQVVISIADDGRGLNPDKIISKAIERGLIKPNHELTPEEINNLIFLPGFSTATEITEISGRGVGMNVVQQSIEKLGGTIQIKSELGKGSGFIITLPTSLAILESFIIRVKNERLVVPINHVKELIDIRDFKIENSGKNGRIINIRGKIVPVQDLSTYLPYYNNDKRHYDSRAALITKIGKSEVAFLVNEVLGQHEVVVKELNDSFSVLKCFKGGTILQDGEPGFILDLEGIARNYLKTNKNKAVA